MKQNENPDYAVKVSIHGKYRLITLENMKRIELYNVKEIEEVFKKGNSEGIEDWVLDLSPIEFIDSSGLSGLANQGMALAKKSKKLLLLSPNSGVSHLFAKTGFDKIFSIIPDKSKL